MRRVQTALLSLCIAATGTLPAFAEPPKVTPAAEAAAKPEIVGTLTDPYLVELKVVGVPRGAAIFWQAVPLTPGVARGDVRKRIVKVEQAVILAGPPGEYEVVCQLVKVDKEGNADGEELTRKVTLTGGAGPAPPGPGPKPTPDPVDPARKDVSYRVVFVEETSAAAGGRGAMFTNRALDARMRERGHSYRIVDKDVTDKDGGVPADLADLLKLASQKAYPQVFLVDKAGKLKTLQFDAPADAAALTQLLSANGG